MEVDAQRVHDGQGCPYPQPELAAANEQRVGDVPLDRQELPNLWRGAAAHAKGAGGLQISIPLVLVALRKVYACMCLSNTRPL